MPKANNRAAFIGAGLQTMFRKGYVGATVRDISAVAGAPQGSFTNHFRSKEEFTSEVLDEYFLHVRTLMDEAASDADLTPRQRLERYLDLVTARLVEDDFTRGCLIGDLSVESPGRSEMLRARLENIYREWVDLFASWIAEAQRVGELSDQFSADQMADFLITGWEGAIARLKVERSRAPLDRFRTVAFNTVFREL